MGLGGLLVALDHGERRFWLDSPVVAAGLAGGVVALAFAVAAMRRAAAPLFDAALVARPSFALALMMAATFRFGLLIVAFVAPQYLARIQGFRVEQLAETLLPMVPATALGVALGWALVRAGRPRLALSVGVLLFAAAAGLASTLSPAWAADEFRAIVALAGLAQGAFMLGVLRYATWGVRPDQGPTAGGLFNLTRVVGQAGGTAAVGQLVTGAEAGWSAVLVETLTPADPETTARLAALARGVSARTADASAAAVEAMARLRAAEQAQAFTIAYGDAFSALALLLLAAAALVWALPAIPPDRPSGAPR